MSGHLTPEQGHATGLPIARCGRRPLVCHHEAGHAVARWWLGFHSDDVVVLTVDEVRTGATITDRRGQPHQCEGLAGGHEIHIPFARETLPGIPEGERAWFAAQAERRIDMALLELYAGMYAEARYRRRSAFSCLLDGGQEDFAAAREIAAEWFIAKGERQAAHGRAEGIARALVRSPKGWAAVQAVAAALLLQGRVDGEEIDTLCSAAYGAPLVHDRWSASWPPTPAQIRAGELPVRCAA